MFPVGPTGFNGPTQIEDIQGVFEPTPDERFYIQILFAQLAPAPKVEFITEPGWGVDNYLIKITSPETGASLTVDLFRTMAWPKITMVDIVSRGIAHFVPRPPVTPPPASLPAPTPISTATPAAKPGEVMTPFGPSVTAGGK